VQVGGEPKDRGTDETRETYWKKKINTKFQFETGKGKSNLGVQGLAEMLKTM
jgi:hypothetical protein